ncbi:MAG: ComF family protein [Lachnospiraceae bacterium]|nr:ComF family protein [Lachnospiraceae bacterium]
MEILKDILYPRRCPFCDGVLPFGGDRVCKGCRDGLKQKRLYVGDMGCRLCGRPLADPEEEYCPDCARRKRMIDGGASLFVYADEVRSSIAGFKYRGRREYADYYAKEIACRLGAWIASLHADALVPVPVSREKKRKRGYNQAELLADGIGKRLGIPVQSEAVIRIRDTAPQKDLNRLMRRKNLKRAFKIGADVVKLKTVILVDDIYTTGSTVEEIAFVLKEAGVRRVYSLTLASGRMAGVPAGERSRERA